jgi:NAD(P)H dehydrogenase (quinone)
MQLRPGLRDQTASGFALHLDETREALRQAGE